MFGDEPFEFVGSDQSGVPGISIVSTYGKTRRSKVALLAAAGG